MVARCLVVSGGSVTLWLVALAPVSLVARWLRWSGESVDLVDGEPIFWWWWLWYLGTLAPVDLVECQGVNPVTVTLVVSGGLVGQWFW